MVEKEITELGTKIMNTGILTVGVSLISIIISKKNVSDIVAALMVIPLFVGIIAIIIGILMGIWKSLLIIPIVCCLVIGIVGLLRLCG